MSNKGFIKSFEIDTGVSADFLENALTKDVTTLEALFDLVDNSIDAARDSLLRNKYKIGRDGLPEDYFGYGVKIRIDQNSVRILDNCSGIDEETLSKRALYTNKPSQHEYGIGLYGIGLKRSLLKMGTDYALSVDNGRVECKTKFTNKSIGGNREQTPIANEYVSKKRVKSFFSVSKLKTEISNDLHSPKWFENAVEIFQLRYGIYLKKGFQIVLHNVVCKRRENIEGVAPSMRLDGPVLPERKRIKFGDVEVVIESGIHSDYVFPGEESHNLSNNRKLTQFFGIYFSCNDRVIVAASTEKIHGWLAKWHSEYNGFVCWVKFISKDAGLLPWNTAKTALRTDSSLFLEVREQLQPIADEYRSEIKKRYSDKPNKSKKNKILDEKEDESNKVKKNRANPEKREQKNKPRLRPKTELSRDRAILVDWNKCETIVPSDREKEYHIFAELCQLSSKDVPIACVMMIRVFLETSVKQASLALDLSWKNLSKTSLLVAEKLHDEGYISAPVKELVRQYCNTEQGLFSINSIQSHVHSTRFHPSQPKANTYWDELDPFLAGCWRYIQDFDLYGAKQTS
ncbi:ATP-binding protein [Vibrio viridaestus]|nr:ATP-binding protein [Vibrio viridaestus]